MTDVVLFHHVQGLTPGVLAFAEELRAAGHTVHTPEFLGGQTFESIDEGMAYVKSSGGFGAASERAVAGAPDGPAVYVGLSLGAVPAQELAQTRPDALGLVLLHGVLPPEEFGGWPDGMQAQIHAAEKDPFFEEDAEVARELAEQPGVELFLYDGDQHLFTDSSLPAYDKAATEQALTRIKDFIAAR